MPVLSGSLRRPPNITWIVSGTHISRIRARSRRGRCSRFSSGTEGGTAATNPTVVNARPPSAEADPRIEECIADVRDDLRQHGDEDGDKSRRLDHVDVAEQRRVEQQLAETRILKEHLDDDDA